MGDALRKYWNEKTQEAAAEGPSSPPLNEEYRRIVILGKTGAGKSSLANTIFGEEQFKVYDTSNSGTGACQAESRSVNGRLTTLIDNPGFYDTDRSEEELKCEILRCITECATGLHAFLIVLKVEKFTKHEQDVINEIHQYFSEELFKYATIVFTHGDQLKEGQTIEEFVCQNKAMSDLVKKCGGRCHVIDNKYWKDNPKDEYRSNRFQVKKLLDTLDKITEANKGGCYTNDILQAVEKKIQKEEELIRQSSGNMSEEEITQQAKVSVWKKLWIKLAGFEKSVLLGAFSGVGASVVLILLKMRQDHHLKEWQEEQKKQEKERHQQQQQQDQMQLKEQTHHGVQ